MGHKRYYSVKEMISLMKVNFLESSYFILLVVIITMIGSGFIANLHSDIFILKSGNRLVGELQEETETHYIINTADFGQLTIAKNNVLQILKESHPTLPLENQRGRTLKDQLSMIDDLMHYVGPKLATANLSTIRTIAIQSITNRSQYDLSDNTFESRLIMVLVERGFKVVDRQHLDILLKEQALELSGLTESGESKVGKLLGVDAFLQSELYVKENRLFAHLKIYSVAESKHIWQHLFSGRYVGSLQIALGLGYTLGGNYTFYENLFNSDGTVADSWKNTYSTQLYNFKVRLSQRPSFTRLFDFCTAFDLSFNPQPNPGTVHRTIIQDGSILQREVRLKSILGIQASFLLRLHTNELFRSPNEHLILYGGPGGYFEPHSIYRKSGDFHSSDGNPPGDNGFPFWIFGGELKIWSSFSWFVEGHHYPKQDKDWSAEEVGDNSGTRICTGFLITL